MASLSMNIVLSPDLLAIIAAYERAGDAILAAGMERDGAVLGCVAAIQGRLCETCVLDAEIVGNTVVMSLADDALLGLFAKFQEFGRCAAAINLERHRGEGRR